MNTTYINSTKETSSKKKHAKKKKNTKDGRTFDLHASSSSSRKVHSQLLDRYLRLRGFEEKEEVKHHSFQNRRKETNVLTMMEGCGGDCTDKHVKGIGGGLGGDVSQTPKDGTA